MTIDWDTQFTSLSSDDLDSIAVLRVLECSNGIIQHRFRDGDDEALDAVRNTQGNEVLYGFYQAYAD